VDDCEIVDSSNKKLTSGNFNLVQACVVALPEWHNFPPLSQGLYNDASASPGNTNIVDHCTMTREFSAGQRRFSMADNPNVVYRVLNYFEDRVAVEVIGPDPQFYTLWPVVGPKADSPLAPGGNLSDCLNPA